MTFRNCFLLLCFTAIITLMVFPSFSAYSEEISTPTFSKSITVRAQLTNAGGFNPNTPDCGGLGYFVLMEYRILEVELGNYPEKTLYATHICPQDRVRHGKDKDLKFNAGEMHKLTLTRNHTVRPKNELTLKTNPELPYYLVRELNLLHPHVTPREPK